MPGKPRHTERGRARTLQRSAEDTTLPKPVGRPKGDSSTIMNVRIPLPLLAQLERYLDQLEWRTGLKANRGMIARRALELFLAAHASDDVPGREE